VRPRRALVVLASIETLSAVVAAVAVAVAVAVAAVAAVAAAAVAVAATSFLSAAPLLSRYVINRRRCRCCYYY
jgi:hypothetical protein